MWDLGRGIWFLSNIFFSWKTILLLYSLLLKTNLVPFTFFLVPEMFLAVDKPARITSFDVIRIFRRHWPVTRRNESSHQSSKAGKRTENFYDIEVIPTPSRGKQKIGHSWTLDPMATGLMILALGDDTKKLTELIWLNKSYIATIDFSKLTDTRDMEIREKIVNYELAMKDGKKFGLEMENGTVEAPTLAEITRKLDKLIPEYALPLPAFSAKKIAGKRSYHDAREGNIREENKVMKVQKYEILNYDFPLLQLKLDVGSGTYIRSIAYRLGKELWMGGTLIQLKRTRIGNRDIDQLPNWEELHNTYKGKEEIIKFSRL